MILAIYIYSLQSDVLFHLIISENTTSDLINSSPDKTSHAPCQVNEIFVVIAFACIFFLKNARALDNHINLHSLNNRGKILKLFLVSTLSVQSLCHYYRCNQLSQSSTGPGQLSKIPSTVLTTSVVFYSV